MLHVVRGGRGQEAVPLRWGRLREVTTRIRRRVCPTPIRLVYIARMQTSTLAQVDGAECAVRCGRRRLWRLCLWCECRFVCSPCLCRRVSCDAGAAHPNHRRQRQPPPTCGKMISVVVLPADPLECCRRHAARRGWVVANARCGGVSLALDEKTLLLICSARGARCQTEHASLIFLAWGCFALRTSLCFAAIYV